MFADSSLRDPLLSGEQGQVDGQDSNQRRQDLSSRNVTYTLLYTLFAFAGRSVWNQSVLATFVYLIKNNNPEAVGYITAVMGICQLVASFPTGFLADSHRRDTLLRLSSVLGTVAIGLSLLACWKENYVYLVIALAAWGLCYGVANTSLSALFADSIATGERSFYFTQRSVLVTLGNTCGPLVSLAMFCALGDTWKIKECAMVMALGQCVCFPAMIILCFFNDDLALHSSNNEQAEDNSNATDPESGTDESQMDLSSDEEDSSLSWRTFLQERELPTLIASADLISGLASGMSIRYFPIFFVEKLNLRPTAVQFLYICSPLLTAVLMKVGQWLSPRFGRLHVVVANKWIGVASMVTMVLMYHCNVPTGLICLIYVLRTAFMNCTGALTRSMLMDNVPREERGKWSALESVNMFSWSGSAALGGLVVSQIGIVPLFLCTATLQFIATLPLVSLFSLDHTESSSTSSPVEGVRYYRQMSDDVENLSDDESCCNGLQ